MKSILSFLTFCTFTLATATQAEVDAYADVYLAFGGDEMADVQIETFDGDIETTNIRAGEGFGFSLGTRFDLGESGLNALLAVGYKSASISGDDGDEVGFTRYPLTAMLFYDFGPVQFGVGATQEINGELDLKDGGGGRYDVDDATGQVAGLDWDISRGIAVGLRYTIIDYQFSDINGEFEGDNVAIIGRFRF